MSKEIKSKYEKYIANIEWHVRVNKPEGKELELCNIKLDCYREILNDLPAHDQFTPSNVEAALEKIMTYQVPAGSTDLYAEIMKLKEIAHEGLNAYQSSISSPVCGNGLRPVVKWFAEQMEAALKRNDHKTGWLNDDWDELHDRIIDEAKELYAECGKFTKDKEKIIKEAADVANFALMIADKFGGQLGHKQASEASPCLCARYKEALEQIRDAVHPSNELEVWSWHDTARELATEALK